MDLEKKYRLLDVTLYGDVDSLSDTLSKCRVRIFYRGLNRNRTYISDNFANQLIKSLPYSPIKGIFNKDTLDFEDHGERSDEGRIYGIIPENPNFAWEKHVDEDGVEREYACADVFLYTALYPEAKLIPGKAQSMEIHDVGLKGEWKIWEGDQQPYYEFYSGHLLGLQTLGDEVEPCFEGSAFFSLVKEVKEMCDYIKKFSAKEDDEKKMEKQVNKNLFQLSDNEKCELLYDALNSSEDNLIFVCCVYDEYAIAYDSNERKYIRAYYTKDDNANTVTITKTENCYMVDVNEVEKIALDAVRTIGSFSEIKEKIDEQNAEIENLTKENETYSEQLKEKDEMFEADKAKLEAYENNIEEKEAEIVRLSQLNADITNEKSELESFKKQIETEQKEAIIKEFAAYLSEEQVGKFKEDFDKYSVKDFKKEVCTTAYESSVTLFNKKEASNADLIYVGNSKSTETGAIRLLDQYKGGSK